MEPFKNMMSEAYVNKLSALVKSSNKKFDEKMFKEEVLKELTSLELKDRVRLISKKIAEKSNLEYPQMLKIFENIYQNLKGFELWPLSQYIEEFGINEEKHLDKTFKALSEITKLFTAEFAIRDYINLYEEKTYDFLILCSKSKNEHLRRLSSEGTRPNLPWGKKLVRSKELIQKNFIILENLKNDESEYVRKSVANHLNDLSRLNTKIYLEHVKLWQEQSVHPRIIRHSLRSLLKAGHKDALKILGYNKDIKLDASIRKLTPKNVKENDRINLSFEITNHTQKKQQLLIDLAIHFLQKNGKYSKKVFRLKDTTLNKGASLEFDKDYHFKKVTTRRHYPGIHHISLQINGCEFDKKEFKLVL